MEYGIMESRFPEPDGVWVAHRCVSGEGVLSWRRTRASRQARMNEERNVSSDERR